VGWPLRIQMRCLLVWPFTAAPYRLVEGGDVHPGMQWAANERFGRLIFGSEFQLLNAVPQHSASCQLTGSIRFAWMFIEK
jgi:hypothetical protein